MIETVEIETRAASASTPPRVRIMTDFGDILVELYPGRAPKSVAAFLAEVEAGSYAGANFGRIVRFDSDRGSPPIEIIQGGAIVSGEPRADVEHESTSDSGLRHDDGMISLPRMDGGLASAQSFFISVGAQPGLDKGSARTSDGLGFAAFGKVVDGMDVVRTIHAQPTLPDAPIDYLKGQIAADPVAIHSIAREAEASAAQLRVLSSDYWQFRLREFPTESSLVDLRADARLMDDMSAAAHDRRALLGSAMLARAKAIDVNALDSEERTTHVLLTEHLAAIVEAHQHDEHHRPQLFPFSFFTVPAMLVQQTPLDTLAKREELLARLAAMPDYLQHCHALLQAGFRRGYRLQRVLQPRVLSLLDSELADSGLSAAVAAGFAPTIPGAPADRLQEQRDRAGALLAEAIKPVLRTVRAAIEALDTELIDEVGLWSQPGGRDYYRFKARQQTSTNVDPDRIHQIGLDEVARIRGELGDVLKKMGRPAKDLAAVAAELDARIAPDAEDLLARTRAFAKRVDGLLPRFFGRMPRITYAVEPLSVAASADLPPALAQPAPADRSLPGVFWLTSLPEKMPLHLIPALTLHEAWPGHLMQISIAHELEGLPEFRRYLWPNYNGYIEGWALYCERLGHDLGLYDDPADQFGLLSFELWRAARLVVDTGIHWLGWSREQAIDYLSGNSFLPQSTCEAEVDRYIGFPAQALSYKMGERVIDALRTEAEQVLGERFSLREFHDTVLGLGPVSLAQLQERIRAWIAA